MSGETRLPSYFEIDEALARQAEEDFQMSVQLAQCRDTLDSLTAERAELRDKVAALEVDLREAVEQWGLYADAESRRAALSEGGSK